MTTTQKETHPFEHKVDFIAFISVKNANCNGDPLNGNRPRIDYNDMGEISDVCIKRKIRNRMQDMEYEIFVQSDDRRKDNFKSLSERFEAFKKELDNVEEFKKKLAKGDEDSYKEAACAKWIDVRSFGQVFAFNSKNKKKKDGDANAKNVSIGIRGPVSIHQATSIDPVEIESIQITKSVNGDPADQKGSDTMGMKHFVRFGLYEIKGSINVQLAEKTGFTQEDADLIKKCLQTLFVNDASSARPDGSMEVVKLFWWQHNCKDGQYSSAKVHRSVHVGHNPDNTDEQPSSMDYYSITYDELPGLKPEVIDEDRLNCLIPEPVSEKTNEVQ